MIVTNKGRRTWPVKNSEGVDVSLEPMESVEMNELDALRLISGYPRDLAPAGSAKMSSASLEREEQSLRDRITNVKKREKAVKEREEAVEAKEKELGLKEPETPPVGADGTIDGAPASEYVAPSKKPGRPPKAQ
jgi:hypothetical protein